MEICKACTQSCRPGIPLDPWRRILALHDATNAKTQANRPGFEGQSNAKGNYMHKASLATRPKVHLFRPYFILANLS